ncbi:MAG TPA: prepilin-type N-terminal cleavage/methylation domain-containing protein, partial [Terriglobales bacterium]|nr:prepilin-type N-terminal cleavage/methylation domain-containing protein [Terriglobales bacterium]
MKQSKFIQSGAHNREGGFTLIEVMIAIVVMLVGVLAVIASLATAVAATQSAEEDLIARQKVLEAMESIY